MKLIFFGTSSFATPTLNKLTESGFEIMGVVTQPDRPAGRNQTSSSFPVKKMATKHKLQVFTPGSLNAANWKAEVPEAELYVVADYGKIIPKSIFGLPKHGTLNIHPSLLPKYRGPSPIHAVILNGDKQTGVTIIKMDEKVDHGDIISSSKFQISKPRIYYQELRDELARLGADLLVKTLPEYVNGKIEPVAQDHNEATYTELVTKKQGRINWRNPAAAVERKIRAYHTWPVAWTTINSSRLKIFVGKALSYTNVSSPGQIVEAKKRLVVTCGKGALDIKVLQLSGKNKMPAAAFLRGQRDLLGQVLA